MDQSRVDPNWMSDLTGRPVPREVAAVLRYFERAAFAYHGAAKQEALAVVRAMLTAVCVHSCQSLREAFQTLDDYEQGKDSSLKSALDALPLA